MTNVVDEHDVLFHKFPMMKNTADVEQGICRKFIYKISQPNSTEATSLLVSPQQLVDVGYALNHSYFISGGVGHTIVSDAVYLYDAADNKIFAVYFWQLPKRVSIAIWDNSTEKTEPVERSKIWPNKFTDALYDKFVLEKPPQ